MADITVTATSVIAGTGATTIIDRGYNFGTTVTAGQAVYLSSSNTWLLSDSDGAAAARACNGIALNGGATGQPAAVQTSGSITIGGTVVSGTPYFVSNTAGGICVLGDLGSADTVIYIGVATSTTVIALQIHNPGAVI